jgi:hypothetical protein
MCRLMLVIAPVVFCVLAVTGSAAETNNSLSSRNSAAGVVIRVLQLHVTETTLELHFEIRNESRHDIWVCDDVDVGHSGFELYVDSGDLRTLRIRRRLDVPLANNINREQPIGRYTRLRSHGILSESLLLHLPVHPHWVFTTSAFDVAGLSVDRLSLEVGYYGGNLPGMIFDVLKDTPRRQATAYPTYPRDVYEWFGGLISFARRNEHLRDRNQRVEVPWSAQAFTGEESARATLENLHIPIVGHYARTTLGAPQFDRCTRAEIYFEPSILEYFFPYVSQQNLFSSAESRYLQSRKAVVIDDQTELANLAKEVARGFQSEIVEEGPTARVVCYCDNERLAPFTVYGNTTIETADKYRFRYSDGLRSLRRLTPEIQPFELRTQCADNLRDLWYRLRLYNDIVHQEPAGSSGTREMVYPVPARWCDETVTAYRDNPIDRSVMNPYRCPSASASESHYAMNPNCKPDSPADAVLLFETNAGWNQHGGPELFTFDNHDPKGGLVLLNDGTVKFIRTEEELKQLRWK